MYQLVSLTIVFSSFFVTFQHQLIALCKQLEHVLFDHVRVQRDLTMNFSTVKSVLKLYNGM